MRKINSRAWDGAILWCGLIAACGEGVTSAANAEGAQPIIGVVSEPPPPSCVPSIYDEDPVLGAELDALVEGATVEVEEESGVCLTGEAGERSSVSLLIWPIGQAPVKRRLSCTLGGCSNNSDGCERGGCEPDATKTNCTPCTCNNPMDCLACTCLRSVTVPRGG